MVVEFHHFLCNLFALNKKESIENAGSCQHQVIYIRKTS